MLLFLPSQAVVKYCGIDRNVGIYIGELPGRSGNRNHLNLLCYLPFLSFQFEADTKRHLRELRLRNVERESTSANFWETKKSAKKKVSLWQVEQFYCPSKSSNMEAMAGLSGFVFFFRSRWTLIRKIWMDKTRLLLTNFSKRRGNDEKGDRDSHVLLSKGWVQKVTWGEYWR